MRRSARLAAKPLDRVDALADSPFRQLPDTDLLRDLIVDALPIDDCFAFGCTCSAFRAAACNTAKDSLARFPKGVKTKRSAMWSSVTRLEWAVGLGCKLTLRGMNHAAENGYLEVLKWARARGCAPTNCRAAT